TSGGSPSATIFSSAPHPPSTARLSAAAALKAVFDNVMTVLLVSTLGESQPYSTALPGRASILFTRLAGPRFPALCATTTVRFHGVQFAWRNDIRRCARG